MAQTYTVLSRITSGLTGATGSALDHERAVAATIAAIAAVPGAGATGTEYGVPQCIFTPGTGPTGTYSAQGQFTTPLTGTTYSANTPEDAKNQHKAAKGPTGPAGNLMIFQAM